MVNMVVTLGYTEDEFEDPAVQSSFKSGVATAAGTTANKVRINSFKAAGGRRMLLEAGVEVDFSIEVKDAAAATELVSSNKLSIENLNKELEKEGVAPITEIKSAPSLPTAGLRFHC